MKVKCAFPVASYRAAALLWRRRRVQGGVVGWQGSPGIAKALQKAFGTFVPFLCCAAVQLRPALPCVTSDATAIPPLSGQRVCHPA